MLILEQGSLATRALRVSGLAGCEFHAHTFDFPCVDVQPRPAFTCVEVQPRPALRGRYTFLFPIRVAKPPYCPHTHAQPHRHFNALVFPHLWSQTAYRISKYFHSVNSKFSPISIFNVKFIKMTKMKTYRP